MVVLGGGIAGCSAALHLAKRGYRVALLEARFVGYGASGRSGGQTIFGLAASQKALIDQVGRDDARRLFDLSIEALDLTQLADPRVRHRLRLPAPTMCMSPSSRGMCVNCDDWARELHEDYGYTSARLLNRDELRAHVQSDRYLGGLIDPRSGHLHPLKFTRGVARAAEAAGALIFENSAGAALSRTASKSSCTPPRAACAARTWCCAAMPISAPSRPRWRGESWASAPTSSPRSRWARNACGRCCRATPRSPTSTGSWIISGARPTTACCSAAG